MGWFRKIRRTNQSKVASLCGIFLACCHFELKLQVKALDWKETTLHTGGLLFKRITWRFSLILRTICRSRSTWERQNARKNNENGSFRRLWWSRARIHLQLWAHQWSLKRDFGDFAPQTDNFHEAEADLSDLSNVEGLALIRCSGRLHLSSPLYLDSSLRLILLTGAFLGYRFDYLHDLLVFQLEFSLQV